MRPRDIFSSRPLGIYTRSMNTRCVLALVSVCLLPAAAFAQADRGAVIGGSVSAANMESHTDFAFAGSFGYRFSRVFGMEIEASAVPTLEAPFPGFPVILSGSSVTVTPITSGGLSFTQIFPGPTYGNPGGRLVMFTNNARVEIPTSSTRVTPYFVAGGGIANVRRTADFTYPVPLVPNTGSPSVVLPQRSPIIAPVVSSSTDLALTIGGGVGVRVMKQTFVEVDLRLFRLLGQEDRNLGRFGVGVRYRF
jgi:opacity protein-like surface antigen